MRDITPGSAPARRKYLAGAALGSALYFSADDGTHGAELWRSDGTAAGTAMVVDLDPAGGSEPGFFHALSDRVLFRRASTGQLWQTDGTPAGTFPIDGSASLYRLVASGGATYASGWDEDSDAEAVWRLEPSGAPTLVAPRTDLDWMFDVGGALFGILSSDSPWRLDRQPPDDSGWRPSFWEATDYAVAGRRLLLNDEGHRRLWTTDGSVEGQRDLQYLPNGERRYWPWDDEGGNFTVAGESIFFSVAVGDTGRELWAMPTDVLPEVCVDDCYWMWTPTPTDTPEPDAPTPMPVPPTPTATANCGERCTVVSLDAVSGAPGETVDVGARLSARREAVAGLDLRFGFAPDARVASTARGRPDCQVNADIGKNPTWFGYTPYACAPGEKRRRRG